MFKFFYHYSSLRNFYFFSEKLIPFLIAVFLALVMYSLYGALISAPADYQQGDSFRIIYVHVPSAWMSLLVYMAMGLSAVSVLVWRVKLAEITLSAIAPIGAIFTLAALVTGSIWGKPMWGTWWEWDARLTSELVLLFLYLGVIALLRAIDDRRTGARSASILCLIGIVNIPIVHYSVEWWNTLHQGPTVSKFDSPSIHIDMLIPLLTMTVAFMLYFIIISLYRIRSAILVYDKETQWVKDLITSSKREQI